MAISTAAQGSPVRRALWGSALGTTLEWYDFFLYGTMAVIVFPAVFFPAQDQFIGTLISVSTFGVAFIARPMGAVLFGHLGDRVGRRSVLVATMVLMGLSTATIGILPSYATAGALAPILLVSMRVLQGLSTGGEWGGAVLMAVENSPTRTKSGADRGGLYGAFVQAASPAGLILSNAAVLAAGQLDRDAFITWGWRIPFLVGGIVAIVGLIVRFGVPETREFADLKGRRRTVKSPAREALTRHPKAVLFTALTYAGPGTLFYVAVIFGQSYAVKSAGMSQNSMVAIVLVYAAASFAATIFVGRKSDQWGHRRSVIWGCSSLVVLTPIWLALFATGNVVLATIGFLLLVLPFSAAWAPMAVFFARSFSPEVRYSGVSLGYQLGTVLGGALPPIIAVALFKYFDSLVAVGAYVMVTLVLSAVAAGRIHASASATPAPAEVATERVA
ncbi:MFS transporter [Rhodococcus olei]|uniref:MFS transporter n=1 Tax=Rhodococcus olei TaxID=2161675 RepID=A0ABP8PLT1_9NOCA